MKYQNKWILTNLGITRKALCIYEDYGLIDKKSTQNPNNRYREYSEDDLAKLWFIWLLEQVGFRLSEIKTILYNPEADEWSTLNEKIERLESEKKLTEGKIHALRYMRATGHIPFPKRFGEAKFSDMLSEVQNGLYEDNDLQALLELQDGFSQIEKQIPQWSTISDEMFERRFDKIVSTLQPLLGQEFVQNAFWIMHLVNQLTYEIINNKGIYPPEDPSTQKAVFLAYSACCNLIFGKNANEVPRDFWARYTISYFSNCDMGFYNINKLGKEACDYICDAIIYFAKQNQEEVTE